jgi:hypothetical protein
MANGAALIDEGLWRRDKEFRALPRLAQCTFVQILSNKDTDCAGILTLSVELLAKACDELTVEQVWIDLKALESARFVFVDAETDELLIRSYVRRISAKSPNLMTSALRRAKIIHSEKLRLVLASELRRLGRKDASDVADQLDPSGRVSQPVGNPSGTLPKGVTLPEPPSVVPVSVTALTSRDGYVGEQPPSPFCDNHPNGTSRDCRACGIRRKARDAWDEQHAATLAAAEAERRAARARELADCTSCDEYGWALDEHRQLIEPAVRCRHDSEPAHA